MKKILLFFVFSYVLFAEENTISVVNDTVDLPKIILKDNSRLNNTRLQNNFYNILVNDLKVSSNFELVEQASEENNYLFEYTLAENNNVLELNVLIKAAGVEKFKQGYTLESIEQYPFLAHKSVKDSVGALGLSPVEWMDNKILIAKNISSGKSQIIMADYTLTYQKVVVSGGLNLFPKWANKEQSAFYYTAYDKDVPTLYKLDLNSNKTSKIISSKGMIVASGVSEDTNKLLLTMAPKDQPDIFMYDLTLKKLEQITNYSGIDVSGNFVQNDEKIIFVSDRLGYPNIFMQGINSKIAEQIVFHGRNNSSVSAYKNYIVYSSRERNKNRIFNIYLMSIDGDYIRQLTVDGENIFPKFSSDGGSIVFIKHIEGQTALGVIRVSSNKSFYYPLKIGKIQSIDW